MRRNVVLIVAVLALALAAPQAFARPAAALSSSLDYADSTSVIFTLTNNGAETLYVPRWQTPIDGLQADIFQVSRDGQQVAYVGRMVKRAEPSADDFIVLQPGETFSMIVDLAEGYDMAQAGQYAMRYRAGVDEALDFDPALAPGSLDSKVLRRRDLGVVESNTLDVWIAGDNGFHVGAMGKKPPAPTDPTYNGCTSTQINTLQTAKANATTISNKAWSYMKSTPSGSLYTQWFGAIDSRRQSTVTSNFSLIYDAFATKNVTFDCTCKQRYYAYVYPTQPYKIYLCSVFWSAPNLGRDSKAGTLVHEMSHFNVTAGTDDYVYGATGALNLALTDPNKAVANADNHEYFAEDQK